LRYSKPFGGLAPSVQVNAAAWSLVTVETEFPYPQGEPEPDMMWFPHKTNGTGIIDT
jgi:hypothetical protein